MNKNATVFLVLVLLLVIPTMLMAQDQWRPTDVDPLPVKIVDSVPKFRLEKVGGVWKKVPVSPLDTDGVELSQTGADDLARDLAAVDASRRIAEANRRNVDNLIGQVRGLRQSHDAIAELANQTQGRVDTLETGLADTNTALGSLKAAIDDPATGLVALGTSLTGLTDGLASTRTLAWIALILAILALLCCLYRWWLQRRERQELENQRKREESRRQAEEADDRARRRREENGGTKPPTPPTPPPPPAKPDDDTKPTGPSSSSAAIVAPAPTSPLKGGAAATPPAPEPDEPKPAAAAAVPPPTPSAPAFPSRFLFKGSFKGEFEGEAEAAPGEPEPPASDEPDTTKRVRKATK